MCIFWNIQKFWFSPESAHFGHWRAFSITSAQRQKSFMFPKGSRLYQSAYFYWHNFSCVQDVLGKGTACHQKLWSKLLSGEGYILRKRAHLYGKNSLQENFKSPRPTPGSENFAQNVGPCVGGGGLYCKYHYIFSVSMQETKPSPIQNQHVFEEAISDNHLNLLQLLSLEQQTWNEIRKKKKRKKNCLKQKFDSSILNKNASSSRFLFFLVPEWFCFFFVKFKTSSFFVSKKAPKDFASRFFIQAKINSKKMIWV